MPKRREVIAGTKTKIYCPGTKCRRSVLAALRTVILGLAEYGNQTKPLKYSGKKKVVFLNQFRADVQTYGHRPRFTADNATAEAVLCAQKCKVAAVSTIKGMRSQYYKIFETLKLNSTILMFKDFIILRFQRL